MTKRQKTIKLSLELHGFYNQMKNDKSKYPGIQLYNFYHCNGIFNFKKIEEIRQKAIQITRSYRND